MLYFGRKDGGVLFSTSGHHYSRTYVGLRKVSFRCRKCKDILKIDRDATIEDKGVVCCE